MTRYFLVDIDNCISNDRHRMYMLPKAARYYQIPGLVGEYATDIPLEELNDSHFHGYHLASIYDAPRNMGKLNAPNEVRHLFVTAMPERYRLLRRWWLREYLPPAIYLNAIVLMRPEGDRRHSASLKVDMVRDLLKIRHKSRADWSIYKAIDDRQDVLDAYETAFNCPTERVFINE